MSKADYRSPDTELQKLAPRLLDELNANPTAGGFCYSVILQSMIYAYRHGLKVEGIRFEAPVLNGHKVYLKATYSKIEGLYTNPVSRQPDLEKYLYRKNGLAAQAVGKNPAYIKAFTSIVEMLKGYAASRCIPYSRLFADNAGMSLDGVFYFEIRIGASA